MRAFLILAAFVILLPSLPAEERLNWFQVRTKELSRGENYRYYAASPLALEELARKLHAKEPLIFKHLVAWSGGVAIPWSDYDKNVQGDILITADNISSIIPLKGDPKEAAKNERRDKETGTIPSLEDRPKF